MCVRARCKYARYEIFYSYARVYCSHAAYAKYAYECL